MVEYITKPDAVFAACRVLTKFGGCSMGPFCPDSGCREVREVFEDVPAADVVEVRHGRWIKDDETGEPICSVCYSGKPTRAVGSSVIEYKLNNHEIRYCYYCGAKMDGGQDDV